MQTIRVGFIGAGRHATKMLYPSLHMAWMEPVAVCDLDEAKARRNARWFGAERVYTDHRRMMEREQLDAVLICTGPKTHAPLTLDAIEYGKPVFVEKPPAMTLAEAEQVRAASEARGVPVMIGTMKRHALAYQRLKAIITSPEFGGPSAIQARMAVGWKNGNGFALLLDMGIHFIDLLRFLMGNAVYVEHQKYARDETHISYAILLRFESGAVGTLFLSDEHHWNRDQERVEVTGDGQAVVAENLVRVAHMLPDGTVSAWEPSFSIPNDENQSLFLGGYAGELQAFARAVQNGAPFEPSLADACAALQIIKCIEPEEIYKKGPQDHAHWHSENDWLAL